MHNLLNSVHNKLQTVGTANIEHIVLGIALLIVLAVLAALTISLRAKYNYSSNWRSLQKLLKDKSSWNDAVLEADKLLDSMLKKRHFKGKTMGERLVSAQHELSANDMVWYSHKLANKIVGESIVVTKAQVKRALLGFWRALKDLDAFDKEKSPANEERDSKPNER